MFFYPLNLAAFVFILFGSLMGTSPAQAKDFLICHETAPFPPYWTDQSKSHPGQLIGVVPKILTEAITNAGLKPVFVAYPWKRCLKLLERNEVDGLFASIYRKNRKTIGRYPMVNGKEDKSRHLIKATYSVFSSASNPVDWDGNFKEGTPPTIGAPLGYVVVTTLKDEHNIKAETAYLAVEALRLVSIRRLDGHIIEKVGGQLLLRQQGLEKKVIPLEPPFSQHYWHFMISHKFYDATPQVAETIWDQIKDQRLQNLDRLINDFMNDNASPKL